MVSLNYILCTVVWCMVSGHHILAGSTTGCAYVLVYCRPGRSHASYPKMGLNVNLKVGLNESGPYAMLYRAIAEVDNTKLTGQ
jgi:hypothetical protein